MWILLNPRLSLVTVRVDGDGKLVNVYILVVILSGVW